MDWYQLISAQQILAYMLSTAKTEQQELIQVSLSTSASEKLLYMRYKLVV